MKTLLSVVHGMVLRNNPKAIAEEIGKPYTTLLREINQHDEGAKLGVHDFSLITRITADFEALDFMERSLGRVAFSLPKSQPSMKRLHSKVAESLKEFGEFVEAVGDSMADGRITAEEIQRVKKEGYDLIQVVALLCRSLEEHKS